MRVSEPAEWITSCIIGAMTAIINVLIVKKECKKRKHGSSTFATKQLRIWSMVCMVSGVFIGLIGPIMKMPELCRFDGVGDALLCFIQFTAMGYYQLARLYYCFASSNVYSNKGYPTWLFTVMHILPALLIISSMSIIFGFEIKLTSYCGVNEKWKFVSYNGGLLDNTETMVTLSTCMIIYLLWDLTTLLLYIYKGISFQKHKSTDTDVFHRIISILMKITVLTILYEIPGYLSIAAYFLYVKHANIWSKILSSLIFYCDVTAINYSMYLMQSHNTKEYRQFLKCVNQMGALKMFWCLQLAIKYELEQSNSSENGSNDNHGIEDTVFETGDLPKPIEQIELSVETTVTNI